ncbi:ethanolamine ammonia-lyase reactivating factor EutA [Halalkalicoccus sp. NIPERK01]|uniref:ethanolamine ammonia-lyase reactivating factor EutA n=1 Tax=Halalkalicoccus sp. NIPERK01 TaxID=3053469 RepID=UPI00256F39B2|nr:ethanolamine ammonia-lyase reactivating factor EutA [Halalkalicoccus sp. NIPERK01]MDL5362174.1 ethanolamine ammonia-lyase reactivating factor EutA [Halalkalicoccus sp. NIPERK01]
MSEELTSVGIDVGTTTTQVVVSDLRIGVPVGEGKLEIVSREIRYRGAIRETPLSGPETVDIDAVARIVEEELAAAGVESSGIETGAVIVTGETARKDNAEALVHRIASEGGEFVAAAAGPALEAILAGRGSGAATRAVESGGTVANADVGGGTTNVALFDADGVRDTRCLDVGGRLVRFDSEGAITGVSEPIRGLVAGLGVDLEPGTEPLSEDLDRLTGAMADCVIDAVTGPPFADRTASLSIGSLPTEPIEVDGVGFTGGVGRLVHGGSSDPFAYDDLGPTLAAAIRERAAELPLLDLDETIRATVVGAGTRTTELSGRTVEVDESLLPLRNLPVTGVGDLPEEGLGTRFEGVLREAADRYRPDEPVVIAIDDVGPLTYDRLTRVAAAVVTAWATAGGDRPHLVLTRQNCAKALGQALRRRSDGRPLAVIDEVGVADGEYLDVGRPLGGGETVPVVVKTLAF